MVTTVMAAMAVAVATATTTTTVTAAIATATADANYLTVTQKKTVLDFSTVFSFD